MHSSDFNRNKVVVLGNFELHSFSHPDKYKMLLAHHEEQKGTLGV